MASHRKLESGRYQVRYRDPGGRERSRTFRRLADARRYEREVEVDKDRGTWSDPKAGKITLAAWLPEAWDLSQQVTQRTATERRGRANKHVLPVFGHLPIDRIDRASVQKWVNQLVSSGLAPSTVKKIFETLSASMRVAVKYNRLIRSPCDGIELPKIVDTEMQFLLPAEANRLMDAITPHYRLLIRFAIETGLRFNEIAGLQGWDYQASTRNLSVKRQLLKDSSPPVFGDPKTVSGTRSVTLSSELGAAIEALRVIGDAPLFTTTNGCLLNLSNFRRRHFKPALKAAGLREVRIHDLRHSAISLWINDGANIKHVTERSGIKSVKTALDRYGHLYPNADQELADCLGTSLGPVTY